MGVSDFNDMELDAIGEIMNISLGASATAVSTMLGTKVSTTPESSPGRVSFRETVRKAFMGEAPRSRAASTRLKSSFSALEYTAKIIKGSRA